MKILSKFKENGYTECDHSVYVLFTVNKELDADTEIFISLVDSNCIECKLQHELEDNLTIFYNEKFLIDNYMLNNDKYLDIIIKNLENKIDIYFNKIKAYTRNLSI